MHRFRRVACDVSTIELQLAQRSLGDFPREIAIESTGPTDRRRVLYRDTPYPELLAAFLRNPAYPMMQIRLPPNQTATLWIRETTVVPRRWWSVHELRVRTRS